MKAIQREGKRVVFTNGCFDLLHPGHLRYLEKARALGDVLVVAVNSDSSVRKIKGEHRPILNEEERCELVAGFGCVDFVTVFCEETPLEIIRELVPDVLAKGGDWPLERIVGRDVVEGAGGKVVAIDFERGYSTSEIISRIRRQGHP